MGRLSVRSLGLMFLTLTSVNVVSAQRVKEHVVKSPFCMTEVNPLKNVCYTLHLTLTDQSTALQACESKGGTLAALDTAETYHFVATAGMPIVKERPRSAWIGYDEDGTQWYDGSAYNYTNWCHDEPSNVAEKCVALHLSKGCWVDFLCQRQTYSICQLPEVATQAHAALEEKTPLLGVSVSTPRSKRSVESKFRCGQYCLQDPLCGKFNFHPTTLTCALYDVGAVVDEADGSQTFTF